MAVIIRDSRVFFVREMAVTKVLFNFCRFVELLGGTIWAESETGKGSTFHFRLPFLLNSPKESPSEMSPQISSKNYPGFSLIQFSK